MGLSPMSPNKIIPISSLLPSHWPSTDPHLTSMTTHSQHWSLVSVTSAFSHIHLLKVKVVAKAKVKSMFHEHDLVCALPKTIHLVEVFHLLPVFVSRISKP